MTTRRRAAGRYCRTWPAAARSRSWRFVPTSEARGTTTSRTASASGVRERGSRERRVRRPRRPAHPLHVLGGDSALRTGSHRAGGARLLVAHHAAPQRAGAAPPVAALPRPVRPAVLVLARGPGGGDL